MVFVLSHLPAPSHVAALAWGVHVIPYLFSWLLFNPCCGPPPLCVCVPVCPLNDCYHIANNRFVSGIMHHAWCT